MRERERERKRERKMDTERKVIESDRKHGIRAATLKPLTWYVGQSFQRERERERRKRKGQERDDAMCGSTSWTAHTREAQARKPSVS